MFRNIMIFLMFLICTFIGYFIGENYKRRSQNLKEIQKVLLLLNNEIIYSNTPLPTALFDVGNNVSEPISNVFIKMANMLDEGTSNSVYESFEKAYLENKEKLSLNSDDYKILEDFFKTLGSSGISGQEKIFSLALENIDINYKEAKKKEKENIKLYRTLGISIGAMLAIFFI